MWAVIQHTCISLCLVFIAIDAFEIRTFFLTFWYILFLSLYLLFFFPCNAGDLMQSTLIFSRPTFTFYPQDGESILILWCILDIYRCVRLWNKIYKAKNRVSEVVQETIKLLKEYCLVLYPQYTGFKSVMYDLIPVNI